MAFPNPLRLVFCVFVAPLTLSLGAAWSQTYVNRVWHYPPDAAPYYTIEDKTYTADVIWSAADSPYVCEAHVTVATGVLLQVEENALIEVVEAMGLFVLGDIQASGATFTRSGERYWRGIYLSPNSNASSLTGCIIRYAGGMGHCYYGCSGLGPYHGDSRFKSIYIDGSSPTISECVVEESWSNGIEIWRGGATIQANRFHNLGNDSYSIVYDVTDTYPMLAANIATGSGTHGVSVPRGRWLSSGTWHSPGQSLSYFLQGSLAVESGATLTLEPGVRILAEGNTGVYVRGTLVASGTPADPIVFSSRLETPSKGDWNGIYLGPGAGGSLLTQCKILYSGGLGQCLYGCRGIGNFHGADRFAALYIDGSAPQLVQCEIRDSRANGIETYGASPVLTDVTIAQCRENGLRMEADSHPVLTSNAFIGNGSAGFYAVTTDASSTAEVDSVSFLNNSLEGVEIRGGHIAGPLIWQLWAPNAPYVITDTVWLDPTGLLAIDPGVVVKVAGTTVGLFIHGAIVADATPDRILFTSLEDDSVGGDTNRDGTATRPSRGNWLGLYFGPGAEGSVLNRVAIHYAGSYGSCYYGCHGWANVHGEDRFAAIYVDTASPVITACTITESRTNGIEIWQGSPILENNVFHNMGDEGYPIVYSTTDTYPSMAGNVTSGTGFHGISVPGGWWKKSGSWNKPGEEFFYFLNGPVSVATGTVLSVSPGNVLKIQAGFGLYINGTLLAEGTPREPIVFTSWDDAASTETWSGIYLGHEAGESAFRFCTFLHGGAYYWWGGLGTYHGTMRYASLYVDSCSPRFDCCTIGKTSSGIEMFASNAEILSSVILDCYLKGILCEGGSAPMILNNTIAENTRSGATGIASVDSSPILTNNIVAFNGTGISQSGSGAAVLTKNCVFGNATDYVGLAAGASDLALDPLFAGSEEGDCHLNAMSPCVNAGEDSLIPSVGVDRDGKTRPIGDHKDIGAYESGESALTVFEMGSAWKTVNWYGMFDLNLDKEVDVEDLILLLRR